MALKTFVKISTVNNLSDARYCAGMQVNLMGFCLEENDKNFVSPDKFKEITGWISGVEYVAEFSHTHPERILTFLKGYPEIHYIEIKEEIHLKMLVNTSYGIILNQKVENINDLEDLIGKSASYHDFNITLLLQSETLELNKEVLKKITKLASKCQVLLDFGIDADTVLELVESTGIKGISMQGGDEIKPGLKDFDELSEILESLETED
ncbi:phosphoribosylanthranilate isomerase [Aquiflexum sp.]|uniref:phosphoribosylanthranilate isomerase n=1 Tax=Aquiflexum sp. TaxID=1872584 RepID=UPI00359378BD